MRVSVFGLGYVGCVTAACLARAGHQVIGVDISADKVAMLNAGRSPIVEPGLSELLADVVGRGRLGATTSCAAAVAQSDLGLISVGTAPGRCMCSTRQLYTTDKGKTWRATTSVSAHFTASAGRV